MAGKQREGGGRGGVGIALIRHQHRHSRHGRAAKRPPLQSAIDVSSLDEVVEQAELAGHAFSTLNPPPQLLVTPDTAESPRQRKQQQKLEEALFSSLLKIPRRPPWRFGTTPQELDEKERESFLSWRRSLARLEDLEKLVVTPFEKNIDIWRQLWRVLERSDLVVIVVDARNPLFYRCPDLEDYVNEINNSKRTTLLLNKADLLPEVARVEWARYLRSRNISFFFWSAKLATHKVEDNFNHTGSKMTQNPHKSPGNQLDEGIQILDRDELLDCLQREAVKVSELYQMVPMDLTNCNQIKFEFPGKINEEDVKSVSGTNSAELNDKPRKHAVVGFVGYPNVGKSSTINALVGEKRAGVTSTPGKTKHFQTFVISDKLTLCDCPGLVFPSFSYSRSDMVALGVLPIDKMTDHRGPVQVVAEQISRARLEEAYGIQLPKPKPYEPQNRPPSAAELIITLARSRGHVSSSGRADETRAARLIMKDYVSGKLLHYQLPPNTESAAMSHSDVTELSLSAIGGCYPSMTVMQGVGELADYTKSDNCLERKEANRSISSERAASFSKSSDKGIISSVENFPSIEVGHTNIGKEHCIPADMRENDDDNDPRSVAGKKNVSSLLDDLAAFDLMNGLKITGPANRKETAMKTSSSHKMHKKMPRRKDRSWRAGDVAGDTMVHITGVLKPVSYGAA